MEEVTLTAEAGRVAGKSVARKVRREGKVPAVVYGLGGDSEAVALPDRELSHVLSGRGGTNTLVNLDVDGRRELVMIRQVQRHPVRHHLLHVDLIRVRRDVAVSAEVPVRLVGEARGVRDGGLLEQVVFTLSVEAKPEDLPAAVEVDVSSLRIGDHLSVGDIALPEGVVTTQAPEEQVAHVAQPRGLALPEEVAAAEAEAEEAAAAAAGEAAEEAGGEAAEGGTEAS